jgi:hypothetical protein
MTDFEIGQTVQVTGPVLRGSVGTVVYLDEPRAQYLVRFSELSQNYYPADEIELFQP